MNHEPRNPSWGVSSKIEFLGAPLDKNVSVRPKILKTIMINRQQNIYIYKYLFCAHTPPPFYFHDQEKNLDFVSVPYGLKEYTGCPTKHDSW